MQLSLVLFLLVTPCVLGQGEFDALNYLERNGYLDDLDGVHNRYHAPDNIKQAIKEFQTFAGLSVSGRLDKPTVRMMKKPRCGIPDVIKPSLRPSHLRISNSSSVDIAPIAYTTLAHKWQNTHLKWKLINYTRKLTQAQQRQTVARALQMWADVTPLTFEEEMYSDKATMMVKFGPKGHGCSWPFDGQGGVLAHAFGPGFSKISGDLHFDDDEEWTLKSHQGINMFQVATHELGHALGLGHSDNQNAVMFPFASPYDPDFHLDDDDIRGIQSWYGPRPGGPIPGRPTPGPKKPTIHIGIQTVPPKPVTPKPIGPYCDLKFDAIMEDHETGWMYIFSGQFIYFMVSRGHFNKQHIQYTLPGAPSTVDAVVYDRKKLKLFLFKGSQYWRYTRWVLDAGYPKTLQRDFQNIDAAVQRDDGQIYVFQGRNFARWREDMTSYSRGFPRTIDSYFTRGLTRVDAAFRASNDKMYMFSGNRYWKFILHGRHDAVAPGFPKDMRPFWLACGEDTENEGGDLF